MTVIYAILNIIMFIFLAPLVQGLIKKAKAFLQMRKGPPLLQMYADIYKYLQKESMMSKHASLIFIFAPYIVFTAVVTVALFVPGINGRPALTAWGDIVMLLYLFALMRFFMALAGLDAGSAFGGMSSSREMLFSSIIEPAFFLTLVGLTLRTHTMNLEQIALGLNKFGWDVVSPSHLLALVAAIIILVTETGRVPVDNPDTHLEVTMIHEGMILEYSGKELALMHWSAAIKQLILLCILANLFLPWGIALTGFVGFITSIIVLGIKIIFLSILLAVIETAFVKFRIFRVPDLLVMSFILSLLAVVSEYYL